MTRRLLDIGNDLGFDLPSATVQGDLTFWHLGDAVRRSRTKAYLQLVENDDPLKRPDINETRLENLLTWIYGNPKTKEPRKIESIRDIPDLDQCLGHPKATRALESGASIREALEEAQTAGYGVTASLDRAKRSVQRATAAVSDVGENGRPEVSKAREDLQRAIDAFDKAFADGA